MNGNPVHPKVKAGAAGGGAAGALTIVLVWAASQAGLDVTPEVASAFTTVLTVLGGLVGGYLRPQ